MKLLAVVLVVGACSNGIPAEDYANELRDAQCDLRVRCGEFTDTTSCDAYFRVGSVASLLAAIGAGKTSYDADLAEQCVNAIRNTPCDGTTMEARELPSACTQFVTGTGAMGDPCASNSECSSARCSIPTCTTSCCVGTCTAAQAPGALGDPCATRACGAGLTCDNTKTCVALFAEGTPCTLPTQCAYGLGCLGDPGTCLRMPHLGEACPDGVCAELGVYCDATKTCAVQGLTGAACMGDTECSPYYPCDVASHACGVAPVLGQVCTTACSDGSWCDTTAGVCTAPQANGAACTYPSSCETGYCDSVTHVCADVPICI